MNECENGDKCKHERKKGGGPVLQGCRSRTRRSENSFCIANSLAILRLEEQNTENNDPFSVEERINFS